MLNLIEDNIRRFVVLIKPYNFPVSQLNVHAKREVFCVFYTATALPSDFVLRATSISNHVRSGKIITCYYQQLW